jgi:glycosyltransferase involved in cell wall biosynthesis
MTPLGEHGAAHVPPHPLISIVLPVHNGSRYLDEAVRSVVAQTFADWELIIVDDASTDDSPRLIDAWAAQDGRIKPLRLETNRKLPGALNEGFRRTTGELLSWTSDDNWYAENALERMAGILQADPSTDVVYADYTVVDADGRPLRVESVQPREYLAVRNCVGACFLHRRCVLEALGGYDEALFLAEDYDFWLRASLEFRLEPLHEMLYYYRDHPQSLSVRQAAVISRVTEPVILRWLDEADWLTKADRGRALESLGLKALIRGDVAAGRRFLRQAVPLLGRLPRFRQCRTYTVDFLFGRRAGEWFRARRSRSRS